MAKQQREEAERWRLFIAVELPEGIKAELVRLQRELQQQGLSDLRWVRPEGIHLTLKFLGETPVDRLAVIQQAIGQAVKGVSSFHLFLEKTGSFGDKRGPRVVWVGLAGDTDRLASLAQRIEQAMAQQGFAPEKRDFTPHLTLARVPPQAVSASRGRIAEALGVVASPREVLQVTEVSLMRSILHPKGALYQRVAAFPLQ